MSRVVWNLVAIVSAVVIVFGIQTAFGRQDRTCQVLRGFVQRSNTTLPTLAYYKEHPAELRKALQTNHELLDALDFCN